MHGKNIEEIKKGLPKCGAKTRAGVSCPNPQMKNGRCHMHGGKTPIGLANANTRTGRYSQAMPINVGKRYEKAMEDEQLMSLRKDIALIQMRQEEKMAELKARSGANPKWGAVMDQLEEIVAKHRIWEWTKLEEKLLKLSALIGARRDEDSVWREIRGLIHDKTALISAESRRLAELEQMMTVEQAMILAASLAEVIRKNVTDEDTLTRINTEWKEIISVRRVRMFGMESRRRAARA